MGCSPSRIARGISAGQGLLEGGVAVRLAGVCGFLQPRGLTAGHRGHAARVCAELCPGTAGTGLPAQAKARLGKRARVGHEPCENVSVPKGSKPDQAPHQPGAQGERRRAPRPGTRVCAHTQPHGRCPAPAERAPARPGCTAPGTRVGTGLPLLALRSKAGKFGSWLSSQDLERAAAWQA